MRNAHLPELRRHGRSASLASMLEEVMRFFRLLYLAFWDWVYRKISGPTIVWERREEPHA
jgi:hypothetical protein